MPEPTPVHLGDLLERLASLNAQLGGLIVEHARLLLTYEELAAEGAEPHKVEPGAPVEDQSHHTADAPLADDALARMDRITYVATMRRTLLRVLYVIDFTLVHGRTDEAMLRDARAAIIDGVDAADAHLLLEGAADEQ